MYKSSTVNKLGACILLIISSICRLHGQPNILFIYTDDQAYWATGASGDLNSYTPHIDKLASEGAFMKNSFATSPVCSPARASLMTSQYASEFAILDFIVQPGHPLYVEGDETGLDPVSVTFAEVLQQNGYKTGLVGKWHLGNWTESPDKKYHPQNHGYDFFMGLTWGGADPIDPMLEKDGEVKKFKGLTTDILTDEAIAFVTENRSHPFLLSLHYRAPHTKWLPVADEDWAPYEDKYITIPNPKYPDLDTARVVRRMKEYLASTTGVDRNIGRLLGKLDSLGLKEETIIIFTSDHGYNMGHNGIEHKGNGKWITNTLPEATRTIASAYRPNLYDNSLRVPAIVRWPGKIKPGLIIDEVTTSLDWFPTILEMTGYMAPVGKIVRGRSLLPLLFDEEVNDWDNDYFGEYTMINYSKAFMRTYRTPEWKLVRDFLNPGRDELYYLIGDPKESENRIAQDGALITEMRTILEAKMIERMQEINDPLFGAVNDAMRPKQKQ